MRKINQDGTLKGYEFQDGYDPNAPAHFVPIPQGEDLIDFPCSPNWVSHFANQGLTRDYPRSFYLDKKSLQPNEVTNRDSILGGGGRKGVVKGELEQLKGQVLYLQSKLYTHTDKSKKRGFKYK